MTFRRRSSWPGTRQRLRNLLLPDPVVALDRRLEVFSRAAQLVDGAAEAFAASAASP